MPEVKATPVIGVEGCSVTEDGQHALLKIALADGEKTLAIPAEKIQAMMRLLATASGQCARILKKNPNQKHVLPAEWWQFARHQDKLILVFQLVGGAEMAFSVHKKQARPMRDALSAMVGDGPAGSPQGKLKN